MQAHWEGSEALAIQVGIAARSALTAADLVEQGVGGPHDVVSGKFGYFSLIETPDDLDGVLAAWGDPWKITEVAHKPFPAGRATQAALTAILDARTERPFEADEVQSVRAEVPSLIALLVDRPYSVDMSPSYARLCLQYVVARMLLDHAVDPTRFTAEWFAQPEAAAIAAKVEHTVDDNPDPNALGPQVITIALTDGTVMRRHVDVPLGAPGRSLTKEQRVDKVARCFAAGGWDEDPAQFMSLFETAPLSCPAHHLIETLAGEPA